MAFPKSETHILGNHIYHYCTYFPNFSLLCFSKNTICQIKSNTLTVGKTSAPVYDPLNKTKIPETLFYNTEQNLTSLEAMLQDYLLGEHLLLIGNQVSLTFYLCLKS